LVVGGGYDSSIIENDIEYALRTSPTTYTIIAVNDGPFSGTVNAQAVCASGAGLTGMALGGAATEDVAGLLRGLRQERLQIAKP
jgi:hypothetical protein